MTAATANAPIITAADRLGLTVFLAAALHAVLILGVAFSPLDLARLDPPASLEVILVQDRNNTRSEKADYLAPISQQGGGESDERNRPSNPFVSTEVTDTTGIAPQPLRGGSPEISETEQLPLLTQLYANDKTQQQERKNESALKREKNDDKLDYDLEIARLTAELSLAKETYAKRPKKMVLTANTHEYIPARYMYSWVEKVERIGNLNYPEKASRDGLEGSLMLEVELNWDGNVVEVNLLQSSGNQLLDDAARRIVELASPFPPFNQDLRKTADRLEIVRTWQFSNGGLATR
ncbi:MAG: energy transducer TonB [Gammaproteobacteria bacterium]|nr:energy transducer TonB [Gammaproteobacteria bacterium]